MPDDGAIEKEERSRGYLDKLEICRCPREAFSLQQILRRQGLKKLRRGGLLLTDALQNS